MPRTEYKTESLGIEVHALFWGFPLLETSRTRPVLGFSYMNEEGADGQDPS